MEGDSPRAEGRDEGVICDQVEGSRVNARGARHIQQDWMFGLTCNALKTV